MLTNPLRDRFGIVMRLEFYQPRELALIIRRSSDLIGCRLDEKSAMEISRRSRGTPRIANRILRRVRDFAEVKNGGKIDLTTTQTALNMLEIDSVGLDIIDRKLLTAIIHQFSGGPVGVANLAAAIGEPVNTIEDVLEPYLIQQGFIQRTPRGRIVTAHTYRHLSILRNKEDPVSYTHLTLPTIYSV